jgi:hypothetical protein
MADFEIVPATGDTLAVGTTAKPVAEVRCSGLAQSTQVIRRLVAGASLSGGRVVRADASGLAQYADSGTPAHASAVCGITRTAIALGDAGDVVESGYMDDPAWAWTPGGVLFCGPAGQLSATAPTSGYSRQIGIALTATLVRVQLGEVVILA